MNQVELERVMNLYAFSTPDELEAFVAMPDTSAFDRIVIAILQKAVEHGDERRMEFVLTRMIGRVTESIEVKTPLPFLLRRRNGEEIVLGAKVEGEEDT